MPSFGRNSRPDLTEVQTGVYAPRMGDEFAIKKVITESANVQYVAETPVAGALTTDAVWRVKRIATSGTTSTTEYAGNGLSDFTLQANNPSSLFPAVPFANTYSLLLEGNANDYGSAPDNASLDFAQTAAFSMGLWVKSTATMARIVFQKASTTAGNNGYSFSFDASSRPEFEFRGTGIGDRERFNVLVPTTAIRSGNWVFLVITRAAGAGLVRFNFYINGTAQAINSLNDTLLIGPTTNASALFLGANIAGAGSQYVGFVDEFAIWNAELTGAEVTEMYNGGAGAIDLSTGSGQISSSLVSWWKMGDGDVYPTVIDQAGANDIALAAGVVPGNFITDSPP